MNTTVYAYLIAMAIYTSSPENNYIASYVIFSMVDILAWIVWRMIKVTIVVMCVAVILLNHVFVIHGHLLISYAWCVEISSAFHL